ncbi:MAG: GNAT family N-acyltransferase [Pseudomonadota bacterium]
MTLALAQETFEVTLAQDAEDIRAAQRLRYDVFVKELGGSGGCVNHNDKLEMDRFDTFADHLLLRETKSGDVVGCYRILTSDAARRAGGFYCETEFDLSLLKKSNNSPIELGRSCLRADVRGTSAMYVMWSALHDYAVTQSADILFGVASLRGTDINSHAQALSILHQNHLAPADLRPRSRDYQRMDIIPKSSLERRAAVLALPALIKGYLRLGGTVGDGAFVDHAFNCTDVCMVLNTADLTPRQARLYGRTV